MQTRPEKASLKTFRDVALLCKIVTQCRVLSFKDDGAIATLGKDCEQAVLYYVGDKLLGLTQELDAVGNDVRAANAEKYQKMREDGDSDDLIAATMNMDADDKAKPIIEKIDELLKKEVKDEMDTISISDGNYKAEFDKEPRRAFCLAGFRISDGYQALIDLVSMRYVKVEGAPAVAAVSDEVNE